MRRVDSEGLALLARMDDGARVGRDVRERGEREASDGFITSDDSSIEGCRTSRLAHEHR